MTNLTFNPRRSFAVWVLSTVVLACFASGASGAHAASFDCAKASTQVEKTVCSDAELSKLDEALNQAYLAAREASARREELRSEQLRWIGMRNACTSQECIRNAYRDRLASLEGTAHAVAPTPALEGAARAETKPRYRMHSGRGWAVCEAYIRTLNSTPANEGPPLCDLKVDRVPGMTRPDLEELRLAENLPLIHEIELLVGVSHITPAPAKDFAAWREQFERRAMEGQKPRLRRFQGALSPGGPIEILLVYDVDTLACAKRVQLRAGTDLAGSFLLLFDPKRMKVLRRNLGNFDLGPHEIRYFNGRLYGFEVDVGGSDDGPNRSIQSAGRLYVKSFDFVGTTIGRPADPEHDAYLPHELCRILFDHPYYAR